MKLKVDAYEAWPHSATVRVTDLDTGATAEATAKTALKSSFHNEAFLSRR
jgi:hypothetical protein